MLAAAAVAIVAGCTDPGIGVVHLYDPAPVPFVPDRTTEVATGGVPADGQYWATAVTADVSAPAITFRLVVAEFDGDGGVTVSEERARELVANGTTLKFVSVVAATRQNYAVTAEELAALVGGAAPSAPAPAGYTYQPYPYLVTVEAGVATEAYQVWLVDES